MELVRSFTRAKVRQDPTLGELNRYNTLVIRLLGNSWKMVDSKY